MQTRNLGKFGAVMLIALAVTLTGQDAFAVHFGGGNAVQNGGFESAGNWTYYGGSARSGTKVAAGSWSLELAGNSYWEGAQETISVFRNRAYYYNAKFASNGVGYLNPNRMFVDGVQVFSTAAYSGGGWKSAYGQHHISGSGQGNVVLKVESATDTGEDGYWDTISLDMERSTPVVTSDSLTGDLQVGSANNFSVYNTGGSDDDAYSIFFDPDITVSSDNGSASITWASDTQADLSVTPSTAGTVTLTLTNVNSNRSYDYVMAAVPEPTTIGLLLLGCGFFKIKK